MNPQFYISKLGVLFIEENIYKLILLLLDDVCFIHSIGNAFRGRLFFGPQNIFPDDGHNDDVIIEPNSH